MRLEKDCSEKEFRIPLDFQEALLLFRLGERIENRTSIIRNLSNTMYDFGYHSNGVSENQVYDFVFREQDGNLLLKEIKNKKEFKTIEEKIKKELQVDSIKEVFIVSYEEWNYGEPTQFEILRIFNNIEDALNFVSANYDVKLDFSNEEEASFSKRDRYKTIDIDITKQAVY